MDILILSTLSFIMGIVVGMLMTCANGGNNND